MICLDVPIRPLCYYSLQSTAYFYYDGWNLVAEVRSQNSEVSTNRYTWGNDLSGSLQGAGGVGGLLAVSVSNPGTLEPLNHGTFYPLYDHNGNVERYVARNGATVAAFQYDAFGNTVSETFTTFSTLSLSNFSYRFSTKYWDTEVGLYYYGYRYYAPRLGRWINRDPIGENGGISLYLVVQNNGVNGYDVLGLQIFPSSGQTFNNPDRAAQATGEFWLPDTKMNTWENCGSVCEHCILGKLEYYTTHIRGTKNGCSPHKAPCNPNDRTVRYWHTHSYSNPDVVDPGINDSRPDVRASSENNFSEDDRNYSFGWQTPLFLTTPLGTGLWIPDRKDPQNPSQDTWDGVWTWWPNTVRR